MSHAIVVNVDVEKFLDGVDRRIPKERVAAKSPASASTADALVEFDDSAVFMQLTRSHAVRPAI